MGKHYPTLEEKTKDEEVWEMDGAVVEWSGRHVRIEVGANIDIAMTANDLENLHAILDAREEQAVEEEAWGDAHAQWSAAERVDLKAEGF
jgi:hypothetical protein